MPLACRIKSLGPPAYVIIYGYSEWAHVFEASQLSYVRGNRALFSLERISSLQSGPKGL